MHKNSTRTSVTQLINETTTVLTKHNEDDEKSSDVHTINAKYSNLKLRDIKFPDLHFLDIQFIEIDFFDIIETIGKIIISGIVAFLISYCLIVICAHYFGFGGGIGEENIATGSQRTGATDVPDKRILIAVTVVLFVTCLVIFL
ncbi:hypothetical protein F8M41_006287 [Gigaspora margarita]|uniref:Uncharacterized protein n=1 Tax=Gigaspora margarita TaxID=4874 RepID=A0A8H3X830_GIGMA|nr:hypothetical protein F8M41_006287 [Gigaspora margarita]